MILKTGRPPRHPRQLFSRPTPPTSATLSAEHTPSRESGFVHCFGGEEGEPLAALQVALLQKRQS